MDQHQGQPPRDLPRIIVKERQRQSYPIPQQRYYDPQTEEPQVRLSEAFYDLLWPTASWFVVIFNLIVMCSTSLALLTKYDGWSHAQVSGVSVLSFAALAIVYKFVLLHPGLSLMVEPMPEAPTSSPPAP